MEFTSLAKFLFLLLAFVLSLVTAKGRIGPNETDKLSLLEFKANLVDPNGVLSSWNTTNNFCDWYGVKCGRRHQRVTVLNLTSENLSGSLSPHIGNLSFLRRLDLENNSFHSVIPSEIIKLRRLEVLSLNNNSFSGRIPSNLSSCVSLTKLDLSINPLEGNFPSDLGALSKLVYVNFRRIGLGGTIPPSIGNLTSLSVLGLGENKLEGKLPDTIGECKNLAVLSFSNNKFSSSIPASIFNISTMRVLGLDQNEFEGSLPSDLFDVLPNLRVLNLIYNKLQGSIPESITNATNLVDFEITSNAFTGVVPSLSKLSKLMRFIADVNSLGEKRNKDLDFICTLTNSTKLKVFTVIQNNLAGVISECIGNLSVELNMFRLSSNFIGGRLPASVGNLVNLDRLEVGTNSIQGDIPSGIGNLEKLNVLDLAENFFSGEIPPTLGNLRALTTLYLFTNQLKGPIPSSIGKCQNLRLLDLSSNNLIGSIPREVISISSLSNYLSLFQNNLTGVLPPEVGDLINLNVLDLSHNNFSGVIPATIGNCLLMEELYLEHNSFEGTVPLNLRFTKGLRILNISSCRLTGQIPEFLQFLNLTNLSLSFNGLEGPLPTKGVFSSVATADVVGNEKLCGGLPQFRLPKCNLESPKTSRLSRKVKLLISAFSALVAIACIVAFMYLLRCKRHREVQPRNPSPDGLLNVSYHILSKATAGFSSVNLIGVGSFGSVYKGFLDQIQMTVAIKVLDLARHGASKSFTAECEALRNTRHRNLVKVITACSGIDHNGNNFKALLYEFMSNGSLDDRLHPTFPSAEPRKSLGLVHRVNIAIDVASALDYLHHGCETSVIHCDLKPSNVLLDSDLIGHVGDFGIARIMPDAVQRAISDHTSSIGVKGSFGYIAPEYGAGSQVSAEGDVYSYGILILEMFTGRRPTDHMFEDGHSLHSVSKAALETDNVESIIDPSLLDEMEELGDIAERRSRRGNSRILTIQDCLRSIIEIGVKCSSEVPRERGDISDIAVTLSNIRDKIRGVGF